MKVFIDTGGWISVLTETDQWLPWGSRPNMQIIRILT